MVQEVNLVISFDDTFRRFSYKIATEEADCKKNLEVRPEGKRPVISCNSCDEFWTLKVFLSRPPQDAGEKSPNDVLKCAESGRTKKEEDLPDVADVSESSTKYAFSPELRTLLRRVKRSFGASQPFQHVIKNSSGEVPTFFTRLVSNGNVYVTKFDIQKLECDICGLKTRDVGDLCRHRKLHFIEAGDTSCNACKGQFKNEAEISLHVLICPKRGEVRALACKFCGEKFPNFRRQRVHEKNHVRGRPQWMERKSESKMCHFCPRVFCSQDQLQYHLRQFHDIDPFTCAHCSKRFGHKSSLLSHLVESHFKELARFSCEFCQRVFRVENRLNLHVAHTHVDMLEDCRVCGKPIKSRVMQRHIENQHSNVGNRKKFPCSVCGKTFLANVHAKNHEAGHLPADQWKFQCKFCGRKFPDRKHLNDHERVHEKGAYVCTQCGKGFTTKQYLADHFNIHTGKRPYVCKVPECQKRFTGRANLRHHLKSHEKQMGVKLTTTLEERRVMRQQGTDVDFFMLE